MIQMISGTYAGIRTASDGPFSLTEKEEARLVARGVAKYVDAPSTAPADDQEPAGGVEESPAVNDTPESVDETQELPDGVEGIPEYSVDNSPAELRAIGKLCGLTFKVGMSKADMVAALDKFLEENTVEGVDLDELQEADEPAPTFDAAQAVVE